VTYRSALCGAAVCVAVLAPAFAASAQPPAPLPPKPANLYGDPGSPDISGLWLGIPMGEPGEVFAPGRGPADGRSATVWAPYPLPYTPPYQKIFDERVAAAKAGHQLGDVSASCLPFGMPRAFVTKYYPDEVVQTPGAVTIFVNSTFPITIWTDGRPHPKDWKPSYNGHSTGYWVGDTLFVDTVGILGITPIDAARNPHSAGLHMTSTIQRVSKDILHVHVTLYDNDAFKEPVTTTNIWQRKSGQAWQVLDDASCFENNKNLPDATGAVGFVKF
jgi:hypothetical protein